MEFRETILAVWGQPYRTYYVENYVECHLLALFMTKRCNIIGVDHEKSEATEVIR